MTEALQSVLEAYGLGTVLGVWIGAGITDRLITDRLIDTPKQQESVATPPP